MMVSPATQKIQDDLPGKDGPIIDKIELNIQGIRSVDSERRGASGYITGIKT